MSIILDDEWDKPLLRPSVVEKALRSVLSPVKAELEAVKSRLSEAEEVMEVMEAEILSWREANEGTKGIWGGIFTSLTLYNEYLSKKK